MVKIKCRAKPREYKRLNAQEVHCLVSEVLQEHFPLAMEGRTYEAQDIWDVLIATAERLTIEGRVKVWKQPPARIQGGMYSGESCPTMGWTD